MPREKKPQDEQSLDKEVRKLLAQADSQFNAILKDVEVKKGDITKEDRDKLSDRLTTAIEKYQQASEKGSLSGYMGAAISWGMIRGILHPKPDSDDSTIKSFYTASIRAIKAAGNGYLQSLSDISELPLSERVPVKVEKMREELESHLKLALKCFVNHDIEAQLKRIPYGLLPLVSLYLGREFITLKEFKDARLYLKMVDVLINDLGCMDTDKKLSQTILGNAKIRLDRLLIYTEALTEDELYDAIIQSFEELKKHQVHGTFESVSDALPEFISQSKITLAKTSAYISMHPNSSLTKFASQISALSKTFREIIQNLDLRIHTHEFGTEFKNPPGMMHKKLHFGIIKHRHVFEEDAAEFKSFYKSCDSLLEEIKNEKPLLRKRQLELEFRTAARDGKTSRMKELIELKVDVNSFSFGDKKSGMNALHRAAQQGHLDVLEILKGTDILYDAQDNDGNTAIMIAVQKKQFVFASELLSLGADLSLKNKGQETILNMLVNISSKSIHHGDSVTYYESNKLLLKVQQKVLEDNKDKIIEGHKINFCPNGDVEFVPLANVNSFAYHKR